MQSRCREPILENARQSGFQLLELTVVSKFSVTFCLPATPILRRRPRIIREVQIASEVSFLDASARAEIGGQPLAKSAAGLTWQTADEDFFEPCGCSRAVVALGAGAGARAHLEAQIFVPREV